MRYEAVVVRRLCGAYRLALTGRINVKGMDCAWPGEGILGRE